MSSKPPAEQELRIVLLGKTGAGKSASGNTILGERKFEEGPRSRSVSNECRLESRPFGGQTLMVVDTPGLFHTHKEQKKILSEIVKFIPRANPGPHVFLWVVKQGSFTKEVKESMKIFEKVFKSAADYTIVLITHGDAESENSDEDQAKMFIDNNPYLKEFTKGSQYHVLHNKKPNDDQVRELVKKINDMVQKNGGFYSSELLKMAGKAIEELENASKEPSAGNSEKATVKWFEEAVEQYLINKVLPSVYQCPGMEQFLEKLQKIALTLIKL